MDEEPSRPAVRRSGAAAGTPLGNTTEIPAAAIRAGRTLVMREIKRVKRIRDMPHPSGQALKRR